MTTPDYFSISYFAFKAVIHHDSFAFPRRGMIKYLYRGAKQMTKSKEPRLTETVRGAG
ncbi:hypothetical protein ACFLYX_01295 [Chloroflexota bacterium]